MVGDIFGQIACAGGDPGKLVADVGAALAGEFADVADEAIGAVDRADSACLAVIGVEEIDESALMASMPMPPAMAAVP